MIPERQLTSRDREIWYKIWSEKNPEKAWREVELVQRLNDLHDVEPLPTDEIQKIQDELGELGGWESWSLDEENC